MLMPTNNTTYDLRRILQHNLRTLRKHRGLSQQQLAETVDLSLAYIGSLEIAIKSPSFDSLCSIANALGVEVFQLLLPPERADSRIQAFGEELESEFAKLVKQVQKYY